MDIRQSFSVLAALFFYVFFILGCTCIDVPPSDSTSPVATLTVIFDDMAGNEVKEYVNTTDRNAPVGLQVPAGRTFTIYYSGSDDGGVKSLHQDYKYYKILSGGVGQCTQPMIPANDFSACPKIYRSVAKEYPWSNMALQYVFKVPATDFHNNRATTPELTVRQGQ